jgi:hypothetical protein
VVRKLLKRKFFWRNVTGVKKGCNKNVTPPWNAGQISRKAFCLTNANTLAGKTPYFQQADSVQGIRQTTLAT